MTAVARWTAQRGAVSCAGLAMLALLCAAPVAAQDPTAPADPISVVSVTPRQSRVQLSLLGGVFGGATLGTADANLLSNQAPTGGQTLLFTTFTEIGAAPLVEGRAGLRLTRALWVEGGVSYAQPDFTVAVSRDSEGAPNVTASSRLAQVVADAGLQYRWPGRRVTPYVMAGGGYQRQLDESRSTAETGSMYYGGGGVLVRLAPASRGWLGRLALRGDVRAAWLRGAITLQDDRGPTLVAAAGLTVGL